MLFVNVQPLLLDTAALPATVLPEMVTPPGLLDADMLPAMLLPDIDTGPELPEALSEPVIFPFTNEVALGVPSSLSLIHI